MKMNIGENLKQLRKTRSITQENLAQFLGVSFQAISKWERNEGYPDITLLPSIANFFEITLDELVGMDQIKSKQKIQDLKDLLKVNQLPTIWGCQELMLYEFLDGNKRTHEIQQTLLTLVGALDICIRDLVNSQNLKATNKEKIAILNKSNQFYKTLHEQKDYYHTHVSLAENYRKMSLLALEDEDIESALTYLENSIDHTIAFDTLPLSIPYTSCLLNTLEYNRTDTSRNYNHTWSHLMLNVYLKNSKYDVIRETERFISMLAKLRKYA